MIYSAGVTQLALVAYVPDAEHNKSASKIDVQVDPHPYPHPTPDPNPNPPRSTCR